MNVNRAAIAVWLLCILAVISACSGSHRSNSQPAELPAVPNAVHPSSPPGRQVVRAGVLGATPSPAVSLCSVYALDGALSFCYEMDEAAGTILHDASAAGNNGTISPSGIAFQSPPLASTSLGSLRGTTSSGQLTSNYAPGAGSFSVSFFMELFANGQNWPFIAATGNPSHSTAGKGWDIVVNADPNNSIYVDIGYGSGSTSFGYMPLTLNTPYNVTLTYNEGTKLATLYVGTASSVSSRSATLPASFAATGTGVLFSGALSFNAVAANASFDEAGYWTGTVLSAAQVTTIAGYTGAGSGPPPTPAPSPTPTPVTAPINDWPTYQFD
ncbi:MAG: hypothetical protein ACREM6_15780, partial [Vulcanimicrobiaceae bacterium]